MAFGASSSDSVFLAHFVKAGAKDSEIRAILNGGLDWSQLLQLLIQFGGQVPNIITAISAIVSAVTAPGGITAASLLALVTTYGPEVYDIVASIAAIFGVTVPPLPSGV